MKIEVNEVVDKLNNLTKYELSIDGCSCCGNWVASEPDEYGDWIKVEDIENIVTELLNTKK